MLETYFATAGAALDIERDADLAAIPDGQAKTDGIAIGTVTVRGAGESGLLLNDTINATVGTVDAQNAGAGTGYAAFRMANRNGRVRSS